MEKKTDSAKMSAKPPLLKSLPPTDEAADLNILRSHHQGILWDHCVGGLLPDIDPVLGGGWEEEIDTGVLKPKMLPDGVDIAPEEVLRNVKCGCQGMNQKT